MNQEEWVILVNQDDQMTGVEEKIRAHENGLLHRAFSVFIYRIVPDTIEILLQQRQDTKYHCGGLWTNTCCSHPRPGEEVLNAARRRLKEEMALDLLLRKVGTFCYSATFSNGLTEHELDHVFVGEYQKTQPIIIDPLEAKAYRWVSLEGLQQELNENSALFTPWFKPALQLVMEDLCLNC